MIDYVFLSIILSATFTAAFIKKMKYAILALWSAGLGVGGIYFILGAEFLAITQWILSTLIALAFIFFSVIFGEFYYYPPIARDEKDPALEIREDILLHLLGILLGASFMGILWFSSQDFFSNFTILPQEESQLGSLGKIFIGEHFLSLEVLALLLFLTLIGGGMMARFERNEHP